MRAPRPRDQNHHIARNLDLPINAAPQTFGMIYGSGADPQRQPFFPVGMNRSPGGRLTTQRHPGHHRNSGLALAQFLGTNQTGQRASVAARAVDGDQPNSRLRGTFPPGREPVGGWHVPGVEQTGSGTEAADPPGTDSCLRSDSGSTSKLFEHFVAFPIRRVSFMARAVPQSDRRAVIRGDCETSPQCAALSLHAQRRHA